MFVATTFITYPPARDEALAYFSPQEIDAGLQYAFQRRFFLWGASALELALLCTFALTGVGRRVADRLLAGSGQRRLVAVLGMGLLYKVLLEAIYFPIGIARLNHAWAWGMSNLEFADWLRDRWLAFGVNLVGEAIVLSGFYLLLIGFPRFWWLLAGVGGSLLGVAYAFLSPLVISPLFNDFTPLAETKWAHLQPRVQALVDKAGVPVHEILVMNASRQSNHTNAYFAGFGSSRRIVLYDTLLVRSDADEIESVLAHELGHWQNDHIVKGIALGTFAAIFAFSLLDRLLRLAVGRAPWLLRSPADPAGLPLILLLVYLGSWAVLPVENMIIRHFERQADQASLDLARQPGAFIAGERKMAIVNRANVAPTPWNVWLFSTHPPTVERIRTAQEWERANPAK